MSPRLGTWIRSPQALELGVYIMLGCTGKPRQRSASPDGGEAGKTAERSWSHPPPRGTFCVARTNQGAPPVLKENLPKEHRFLSACGGRRAHV